MRIFYLILAVIVISGVPAAFGQEPPPAQVVVSKIVQKEVAENRSFLGALYYERISRVSSEVAGLVKKVEVRSGIRVEEGTPLVFLDTDMLDKEIAVQRTRIEQTLLQAEHAEKDYKRLDSLYAKSGVSEKDLDDARFTYRNLLKEKEAAATELEKLLLQKRKSIILAPFAGVILEKNVDSGDWVQQGKQLVAIGSADDLFVKVPVGEDLLEFVARGSDVAVEINAFHRKLIGTVEEFDPVADPKTRNVFLKIRIPAQAEAAANMSATVFIPTSVPRTLSLIPRDALIKFQGSDFVYTVKDNKAAILPVHIVTYLGDIVGADNPYLAPGMPVVVEGNERLRPDQAVTVAGEK